MKIAEILRENVSTEASVKTIVDILTTQMPSLYRQLSAMAEKYAENHGGIDKGFHFVSGGPKSRWFHEVFFKEMKPALYNLMKSLPSNSREELKMFLDRTTGKGSFKDIQDSLISILGRIAVATKNKRLDGGVAAARHALKRYYDVLGNLGQGDDDDEPTLSVSNRPEEPNLARQQNAAVEEIINDALARLGGKQAGEIRNAIAKSSNKLQALQQEFSKRGIVLEDISQQELNQVEVFADRLWSALGIDVAFTHHFIERLNDERNGKPISIAELISLFKKEYQIYGKAIRKLDDRDEAVMKDLATKLNLPFVIKDTNDGKTLVAKTIMRKPNFHSTSQEFAVR